MGARNAIASRAMGLGPSSSRPAEEGRELQEVGDERDAEGDGGSHRADEDVAVADVADLVGEHAPQLVPVEDAEDALGHGHGGVVGAAAGGEGVGLLVGGDVQLGHRHARLLRELAHDGVVLGHLLLGDRLGPGGLDGQLVAVPVREAHEGEADGGADDGALAAPDAPPMTMRMPPSPASRTNVLKVFFTGRKVPGIAVKTLRAGWVRGPSHRRGHAAAVAPVPGAPLRREWPGSGGGWPASRSSPSGCTRRGCPRRGTCRRCGGRPRTRGAGRSRDGAAGRRPRA